VRTAQRQRLINHVGLTVAQIAARLGTDVETVRKAMRRVGIPASRRVYPPSVITPVRNELKCVPPVGDRISKYHCIRCGAFCGIVRANGDKPDGPECDDAGCPAIEDLGRTVYGSE